MRCISSTVYSIMIVYMSLAYSDRCKTANRRIRCNATILVAYMFYVILYFLNMALTKNRMQVPYEFMLEKLAVVVMN